jgi:hypothetical protein
VRPEGLGKLKTIRDIIGNLIRDLSTCSEVPQPPTLPHDPVDASLFICSLCSSFFFLEVIETNIYITYSNI